MRRALVALPFIVACSSAPQPDSSRASQPLSTPSAIAEVYVELSGPGAIAALPATLVPTSAAAAVQVQRRISELGTQRQRLQPKLDALGAQVVADIRRLANIVQVRIPEAHLAQLSRLSEVVRVERVPIVERSLASAVPAIGATEVWARAVPLTGNGITIGIVDSGIDYTHADFGGAGTSQAYQANDPAVVESGSFPTAKVVGGTDFVGDDYNPSGQGQGAAPKPDGDPLDCLKPQSMQVSGGHGTHVAGIAAGMGVLQDGKTFSGSYSQSFDPASFRVAPGVAPQAKLYALKIFGCEGGTTQLAAALERAVDPNKDGNLDDRLDVVNASLGTAYAVGVGAGAVLVKNLTKAGSLLVVAAGNEGQSFWAAGTPAVHPEALSVAASVDAQLVALQVASPASIAGKYPAAEGGFTTRLIDSGTVSGPLVASEPANGCSNFSNASAINGKVALIQRGQCTFSQKFNNAVKAGAIAGVIVDSEDDALPFAMNGGDPGSVSIPGVMINKADGTKILAELAKGVTVTLDPAVKYEGIGAEFIAGFSSRGPSAIDGILKPEIAAPGVSIDSARVGSGSQPRRSQGTSMASPMVAGAAALMRQAQPTWSPAEVKAALMNTAARVSDTSGAPYPPSVSGAGRVAIDKAVDSTLTVMSDEATASVAVSFGALLSDEKISRERSVTVKNHGAASADVTLEVDALRSLPGVQVQVEPAQLSLGPGESKSATLTLSLDPEALGVPGVGPGTPDTQFENPRHYLVEADGWLKVASASETVSVPYQGVVRAEAKRKALALSQCAEQSPGVIRVPIGGTSAHPKPVVTAFELGAESPRMPTSDLSPTQAMLDILAVGAASNLKTAETFDDATAYIAVAVAGEWTTPARGAVSLLSVAIDADLDGQSDYVVRAEPLTAEGPYADVLAATTYRLSDSQPLGKRFLNIVDVNTAATEPYYNSVMILPTYLKDLGLTSTNTRFAYAVVSQQLDLGLQPDQTPWVEFDAAAPLLDTAMGDEGRPLFLGDEVLVGVSDAARQAETPPSLLLLHHNNVEGQRFEIVKLDDALTGTGDLVVKSVTPESLTEGQVGVWKFQVFNEGTARVEDVVVTGSAKGAKLSSQAASQGDCTLANDELTCQIGPLDPASGAEVHVALTPSTSSPVTLKVESPAAKPCEANLDDNVLQETVDVGSGPNAAAGLSAHGGCTCSVGAQTSPRYPWALLASALALLLRRRRRG
ncbi:MAG: S8 family serine peptidase [Polyangiaceae bacterium]